MFSSSSEMTSLAEVNLWDLISMLDAFAKEHFV